MLALAERPVAQPCPPFCPNCGIDFLRRDDVEIGDLRASLYGDTFWRGNRVKLTLSEAEIVQTLARAPGRYVLPDALLNVLGSAGTTNLIAVMVCRIRLKFREAEKAMGREPTFDRIESRRGCDTGYRWVT